MSTPTQLSRPSATILILCSACTVASYALNPTGRYLVEMSRLIRDPQLQRSSMNSVAAPLRPEETAPDVVAEEEDYDNMPPFPDSRSVFDGPIPTQARRKMLEVTMKSLDDPTPNNMGYDLFDALDRHLKALDEQIETSSSLESVLDEQLSSLDMEYDDKQTDAIFYEEPTDFETQPFLGEVDDPRNDGSVEGVEEAAVFYEEPTDFETQPFLGEVDDPRNDGSVEGVEEAAVLHQEPMDLETQPSEFSVDVPVNKNTAVLITQPDTTIYEEDASFEAQSPLDNVQTQNNAHIIGVDSFGFSTIHAEAVHSFETYRPKGSQFVSIQHMKGPPPLPETTDPYELLGFSYHNPPKDADDIRRAYVKRAKKYHPDAIHPASNDQERELAARNFKRINDAYRKLKDEKFRLQEEFFATTMGGSMYDPRGSGRHIRRPFSYGRDFDESESMFSGSYSAKHGARYGETRKFWEKRKKYDEYQRKGQRPSNGREKRSSFGSHHQVRHNCHVSDSQFPPFFSY